MLNKLKLLCGNSITYNLMYLISAQFPLRFFTYFKHQVHMVDHNVSKLNIHVYQIYICLCAVYILVHNDCQLSHPIEHTLLSKCMEEKVRLQLTLEAVCSWALASLGLASVPLLILLPLGLASVPLFSARPCTA